MIYPLTIILILMGGAASAAILIVAAWDADLGDADLARYKLDK